MFKKTSRAYTRVIGVLKFVNIAPLLNVSSLKLGIKVYVSIMYVYVLPYIVYDNCQIRYLLDVLSYLSMYVAVYLESSICSAIYIVYDI